MADNYLENKMDAFREGRTVVRRPSASLETLLQKTGGVVSSPQAGLTAPPSGAGPLPLHPRADMASGEDTMPPMPVQVQAVVRAGTTIKESKSFRYDTDEKEGIIRVLGPTSPRRYLVEAGEVIMAMRLKAAELHLGCEVKIQPESTAPANPLIATLKLYRITYGQKNSTEPE